jgi:endonuclease-8/formamidopyrimidine-DNA glycosylase
MDQSVLAGVGNIYRAELLYRARVHPNRPGTSLAARTLRGIWRDAVVLMADGVRAGRIVTTDPEDRHTQRDAWYVYHRDGTPCLRCGTRVQVADLTGRKVYWCPRCQRMR